MRKITLIQTKKLLKEYQNALIFANFIEKNKKDNFLIFCDNIVIEKLKDSYVLKYRKIAKEYSNRFNFSDNSNIYFDDGTKKEYYYNDEKNILIAITFYDDDKINVIVYLLK